MARGLDGVDRIVGIVFDRYVHEICLEESDLIRQPRLFGDLFGSVRRD